MNLVDLQAEARRLFPLASSHALDHPGEANPPLRTIKALCWQHFAALGFSCMANCFDAAVPRVRGRLALDAWSTAELTVTPWKFRVECRPFWLGSDQVHFAIHHEGPLPGVTETGYRSIFVSIGALAESGTPEEYIRAMFPQTAQLALF